MTPTISIINMRDKIIPPDTVYCGRACRRARHEIAWKGSALANPFSVKGYGAVEAVAKYRHMLFSVYGSEYIPRTIAEELACLEARRLLALLRKRKTLALGCWGCKPCHVEVIRELLLREIK